jgi:hypothetical protein
MNDGDDHSCIYSPFLFVDVITFSGSDRLPLPTSAYHTHPVDRF